MANIRVKRLQASPDIRYIFTSTKILSRPTSIYENEAFIERDPVPKWRYLSGKDRGELRGRCHRVSQHQITVVGAATQDVAR